MIRRPPKSPLFPYTPLSRSCAITASNRRFSTRTCSSREFSTASRARLVTNRASPPPSTSTQRSEEHTSELQSRSDLVCRLLLEKKKKTQSQQHNNTRAQSSH